MRARERVKAGPDLKVFFPLAVKAAPGRRTFVWEGEKVIEVDTSSRFVRRSIRCGDLVVVKTESVPDAKPKRTRKRKAATPGDSE